MSTFAGHSDLHALQDRHRSSDCLTCSSFQPLPHDLALEQLEQHVRAAARAVLFLERHHVARAHRPGIVLAALAQADAPEHRPLEGSLVVRKRELRRGPLRRVVGAEPEVLGRQIGVDDLARVHLAVRIPDRLELAERAHDLVAEHLRQQRAARLAVAVLARQRPAVGDDEVGGAIDELAVLADALLGFEIPIDPHVNAAVAEVTVERRVVVVLVQERPQLPQIRSQLLRRHRRIVPALPLERRAGRRRGRARTRLADLPHRARFGRRVETGARRIGHLLHALDEPLGGLPRLLGIVESKLDEQVSRGPPASGRDSARPSCGARRRASPRSLRGRSAETRESPARDRPPRMRRGSRARRAFDAAGWRST